MSKVFTTATRKSRVKKLETQGSSHTSDLKLVITVAILPDARHHTLLVA